VNNIYTKKKSMSMDKGINILPKKLPEFYCMVAMGKIVAMGTKTIKPIIF